MKKIIFFLVLFLAQNLFCQDSIYKKNGEIIASKVLEISDSNVKFKKADNLEGPVYDEPKSGLLRIKYMNGFVDTIKSNVEIASKIPADITTSPLGHLTTKPSLMYMRINDRELYSIIELLPPSDKKNKIKMEYALMKHYKRNQYLANSLGFGIGFAVPIVVTFGALDYSISQHFSDQTTVIIIGALVGAAIRTTGQVLMKVNKNKRLNARRNVMKIYDELN